MKNSCTLEEHQSQITSQQINNCHGVIFYTKKSINFIQPRIKLANMCLLLQYCLHNAIINIPEISLFYEILTFFAKAMKGTIDQFI